MMDEAATACVMAKSEPAIISLTFNFMIRCQRKFIDNFIEINNYNYFQMNQFQFMWFM